ncbi:MAG: DUF1822 family protein [Oscillatoria princeps RMCB-10]|jgi:hypothetical protein|nr:DUF1822 family protein [Oscillatoria princeps RMCB-10]
MSVTDTYNLTIPLGEEARARARKFAAEQETEEKQRQVYYNTLAVWAVNSFVLSLNYETDLSAGESWNPVIRMFHDVADLTLPDLGRLECRPCYSGETEISLPVEVTEDRLAYVAVRFEGRSDEKAQLLGFMRAADVPVPAIIKIEELEEIESLLDYLFRLESGIEAVRESAEGDEKVQKLLEAASISMIIAQLERIYRLEPEYEWRGKGGDVVISSGVSAGGVVLKSTNIDEDAEIAAQDLAESLLEKLVEIWGEPE